MKSDVKGLIEVMETGLQQMGEYGEVGFTTDVFEYFAEMLQTADGQRALQNSLQTRCMSIDQGIAVSAAVCVVGALLDLRGNG